MKEEKIFPGYNVKWLTSAVANCCVEVDIGVLRLRRRQLKVKKDDCVWDGIFANGHQHSYRSQRGSACVLFPPFFLLSSRILGQ